MFPTVKKRLSGFLLGEEGKITRQSLLSLGSIISAAVIGGVLATKGAAAAHFNFLNADYSSAQQFAFGTHGHHSSSAADCVGPDCDCTGACGGSGGTGPGASSDGSGTGDGSSGACACACACACSACD